jgi:hypothetical protein
MEVGPDNDTVIPVLLSLAKHFLEPKREQSGLTGDKASLARHREKAAQGPGWWGQVRQWTEEGTKGLITVGSALSPPHIRIYTPP